jgi:PAS domain S-box-containing protein
MFYEGTVEDITESRQATDSLAITLKNIDQGIMRFDAEGRCVFHNEQALRLLDLPPDLMARQPTAHELVLWQQARGDFGENLELLHADKDRDFLARIIQARDPVTAHHAPTSSYIRRTRQGRILEILSRILPDGGSVRTYTDVTESMQTQEALARQQAMLSALVDNIPDRIWLKDVDGVYLLSNPAHQRQHGLTQQQIVGRTAQELFGDRYGTDYREADLQAMASRTPMVYEDRLVNRETGAVQYFELVKVAMRNEAGRCTGLLGIARDITARKQVEAELIAARDAADAGNRAKADFLANMSHEIRTPMNAVIGMSDLLMQTPLSAQQQEFAEIIRTSGEALLALINGILDFSRIDSGHLDLECLPLDLVECLEGALDLNCNAARDKGLDLLYWIDDEVPRTILGDGTRLRQIFVNLISNAVKFTARGEVCVRLGWRQGADGVPLLLGSVRDTGIGIAADRLDRLFKSFSQVDASTTRQYGGTGLGLAICRRLLTLMGGRIWVESIPGAGSCFHFEMPCRSAEPTRVDDLSGPKPALAARRLLVVAEDGNARHFLECQTRRWGMQVLATASWGETMALLQGREPVDAAVIDLQWRDGDGHSGCALVAALRQRYPAHRLPLLALTTESIDDPRIAGLGLVRAIGKPLRYRQLLDALRAAMLPPVVPPATGPASPASAQPPLAQRLPLRILLAEDNAVNLRVTSLILSGLGYDIEIAADGRQALDRVLGAAPGKAVDVVLMDVQMPVMDGLDATREIVAQIPRMRRPWIIAMTANAMEGDQSTCLAAGMDDYLSKPARAAAIGKCPGARPRRPRTAPRPFGVNRRRHRRDAG